MSEQKRIPRHVAIIMDGNGRWAAQHGLERFEGHIRGVESVRRAIQAATRHGVRYLTLYAFSTENWGRPAAEVDALMELFCKSVINETPELAAQGVRVRIIGDIRHLLKANEMLGMRFCVLHNLYFYNNMMKDIREAIEEGRYQSYKKSMLESLAGGEE